MWVVVKAYAWQPPCSPACVWARLLFSVLRGARLLCGRLYICESFQLCFWDSYWSLKRKKTLIALLCIITESTVNYWCCLVLRWMECLSEGKKGSLTFSFLLMILSLLRRGWIENSYFAVGYGLKWQTISVLLGSHYVTPNQHLTSDGA